MLKIGKIAIILLLFLLPNITIQISSMVPYRFESTDWIEAGTAQFYKSNDETVGPSYSKVYTIPINNILKFGLVSYFVAIGWRSTSFVQSLVTQDAISIGITIQSKASTSFNLMCFSNLETKFYLIQANYMVMSDAFKTRNLIYELYIQNYPTSGPACTSVGIGVATCQITTNFPTNSKNIYSIQSLKFQRDTNMTKSIMIKFSPASSISLNLQVGQNAILYGFSILLLGIPQDLFQSANKRRLMLDLFSNLRGNNYTVTTTITTDQITIINYKVTKNTFFVGIRSFRNMGTQLYFFLYINNNNRIAAQIHFSGVTLRYEGIAITGFTCPKGFYLDEPSQQCLKCMTYCSDCAPDPTYVVRCLQCISGCDVDLDKLTCQCTWPVVITNVCRDFSSLNLSDCRNVEINNTIVQCNFCSPILFKVVQNNVCVCQTGYDDLDQDGVCAQTCGDGLIFNHECDDGNTNSNDGCSSSCVRESGFTCDTNMPTYCESAITLSYKISQIQKVKTGNKATITLEIMNDKSSLPYDFTESTFQPVSTYIRLFLVLSESPLQEMEITDLTLLELTANKNIVLEFSYNFTVENVKARVDIKYAQTRYSHYTQEVRTTLAGVSSPLVYSENLETYSNISIMLLVGTGLSLLGMLVGLLSPKFIGLESLLTLQLVFYSQLLITDPSRWPVGFMYLKYLKFTSGFNDVFAFTTYVPLTDSAKKMNHLEMKKMIGENLNINFVLFFLALICFAIMFIVKYVYESRIKQQEAQDKNNDPKLRNEKEKKLESAEKLKTLTTMTIATEKAFWILDHLSLWMVLPLLATISAHTFISSDLTQTTQSSFLQSIITKICPILAVLSLTVICLIGLNNFLNVFLSEDTIRKINLKPEEKQYKRVCCVYLSVMGSLIMFFNETTVMKLPMSAIVLTLQILYVITLLVIHPYKQSLRVHSVTLMINQCVYTVFLAFINLINYVKDMDELLIIMLGYFITGCCGILMILTVFRLYYELRYGEALEKKIQKQRQKAEELKKKQEEEQLEKKKKQFQEKAKNKQNLKDLERSKNQFLFENQVKEDEANDLVEWLEERNWDAEEKQKFFYEKFAQKPLEWLQKNDKAEYLKAVSAKEEHERKQRQKSENKNSDGEYQKVVEKLKKECNKNLEMWERQLAKHERKIKKDMNYNLSFNKDGMSKNIMRREYQLKQ